VIVSRSAVKTNPPSTAMPALMPPTGTPASIAALTARWIGVPVHTRT
jgi:hypothetical protein